MNNKCFCKSGDARGIEWHNYDADVVNKSVLSEKLNNQLVRKLDKTIRDGFVK
jgi:hypothetical protein